VGILSGKSTQSRIDDAQQRLEKVQAELDALNLGTAPTADLDAEEAAALKRLARREALSRVSTALSAELAELRAKLQTEQEEERKRQVAKLQVDIDKAHHEAINELWAAYEAVQAWADLDTQMGTFKPSYGVAGREANDIGDALASILERQKAVKVSVDGITRQKSVVRIKA
jgi:hypothetical protein